MFTKSKISYLRSLADRKTRQEHGVFIVEGKKSILEVVTSDLEIVAGYITHDFIPILQRDRPFELITERQLKLVTMLTSNRDGIAIVRIPPIPRQIPDRAFTLVLDGINDPGNLGTIMRTADWYGIDTIIASHDTVDSYNPKTIIASMGSFTRVRVMYTDIAEYLSKKGGTILGATLDGVDVATHNFTSEKMTLVIGSESHGIRANIIPHLSEKIMIPRIGHAESLNASIATAILLDRMLGRRQDCG